jgi:hypothetical protein
MTFSPYALEPTGESGDRFRLADRYLAAENPLTPVRLTRFRLNVSNSFDGGAQRGRSSGQRRQRSRGGRSRAGGGRSSPSASGPTGYLKASIPWSLGFDFSYSFSKPRKSIRNQNATLNTRFSLNVTPRWYLEGRTGYDFIQDEVATTSININRDIGGCRCWVMSFSWVPFGARQSYSFSLQVKSGQLSQLLRLQIPSAGQGGPLGGFGDRLRTTVGRAAGGIGGGRGGPSF